MQCRRGCDQTGERYRCYTDRYDHMERTQHDQRFYVTVKAAPKQIEDAEYTDYFFAYFAGEGYSDGEQIYFASSQDGMNWDDLNNNHPILTSTLGEKGVRDPFIIVLRKAINLSDRDRSEDQRWKRMGMQRRTTEARA